jgi:hypothetical protein
MTKADGTISQAYRTDYEDARCIKNNVYAYITGNSSSEFRHSNVYLKVILNLGTLDCPTCQNVLYVSRYPVNVSTVSSFATLPYAACGVLPQAKPATINAICTGAKYIAAVTLPRSSGTSASTSANNSKGQETTLHSNRLSVFPNPATAQATLRFFLAEAGAVRLSVHDAVGREVKVVLDEARNAGAYEATVNTSNLTAGLYYCRLQNGSQQTTRKLVVTR